MAGVDREAAARAIDAFLRAIGRDPAADPNLRETGGRVAAAFIDELCDGYAIDPEALLAKNVVPGATSLVVARDVSVTTTCPHHLLPSFGTASVAFAPKDKLVGVGTLVSLVDACAHRLALQEDVGEMVARSIVAALGARWAACRLVMTHGCMVARGERRHGSRVESLAVAGEECVAARAEIDRALGVGT